MLKNARHISLILLITLVFTGCSEYQKIYKSTDNDLKYESAIAYYEKKDYYRALQLFDQIMPTYRGTEREEKISYYYAYAYYYQKDYILAGYYFKRFADTYPTSRYNEECLFMTAYCSYLNSPPYYLDQTSTLDAIRDFQVFINRYPTSDRVPRANELIDQLRLKLEEKNYKIALLYLQMEEYKAAIVSFQNLMKDYPDTKFREESMYYIIEAWYKYAENSIPEKRIERHQAAIDAFNDFKAQYPESRYLQDAQNLIKNSYKIAKIKS